jgi:hypothetical protein
MNRTLIVDRRESEWSAEVPLLNGPAKVINCLKLPHGWNNHEYVKSEWFYETLQRPERLGTVADT